MKRYQCKHAVEAMRWDGTSREILTAWHETRDGSTPWFREGGIAVARVGGEWHHVHPGEWLLRSDNEFLVMDDEQFRDTYEEVP